MHPEFLVCEDLRNGRVEATLTDWTIDSIALHIVTPPGGAKPTRVQALIIFLAQTFGGAPWAKDVDHPIC